MSALPATVADTSSAAVWPERGRLGGSGSGPEDGGSSGGGDRRRRREVGRIKGIDLARGLAMAGMVIVHFVSRFQEPDHALTTVAGLFHGRAMPLFMLLGGVGVSLLTARSATPNRDVAIRAVLLFALGLYLTETVDRLAIVLPSYGLLFVIAMALRKAPSVVLLGLVPVITAVGAVTYQTVGVPAEATTYDSLLAPAGIESLLFDGYYPVFPVAAFFVFGLWLGRLDLRSDAAATMLAVVGAATAVGVHVITTTVVSGLGLVTDFGGRAGDGQFHWSRLLDLDGHSAMPVWVVSALGTSAAVLGLSLLIARRLPNLVHPLIVVGSMSLSFYVFQAWLTNVVPETADTSVGVEWLLAIGVYLVFTVFALVWKRRFRSGPLERVLRVGSGPKRLSAAPSR